MNEIRKIKLDEESLRSGEVAALVDQLQKAKEIPLVREIGQDKSSKDSVVTIITFLVVGLFSGLVTWLAWGSIASDSPAETANMLSSVYLTFSIAILLVLTDTALTRSLRKVGMGLLIAIPAAGILSYLFGLLANALYQSMTSSTYQGLVDSGLSPMDMNFYDEFSARNHLNRGVAWALLGLAAGLTVAAHSRSVRRILVTGAGGLIGGFIGGFVFDFITGGEDLAQIIGLAITGGAVGLAVSLLEQAAKQSWIEIVKGGMAGKQFILYQREITIGSSPGANITLIKDPAISPIAAKIVKRGNATYLVSQAAGVPVSVNGQSASELILSEGALVVLGGTELRFREKSKKIKNTTIVRN
jgi:MFS family permease